MRWGLMGGGRGVSSFQSYCLQLIWWRWTCWAPVQAWITTSRLLQGKQRAGWDRQRASVRVNKTQVLFVIKRSHVTIKNEGMKLPTICVCSVCDEERSREWSKAGTSYFLWARSRGRISSINDSRYWSHKSVSVGVILGYIKNRLFELLV